MFNKPSKLQNVFDVDCDQGCNMYYFQRDLSCYRNFCRSFNRPISIYIHCTRKQVMIILLMLALMECYFNFTVTYNILHRAGISHLYYYNFGTFPVTQNENVVYYKYPLINSEEVEMDYETKYNSSYQWFTSMKHMFKNIAGNVNTSYPNETPSCQVNKASLGPISIEKNEPQLEWIERWNPDVKLGGYHAPAHCYPTHRVAVIVPYRNRRVNLAIFLRYIHPLLKKQLLLYRIFVMEQYGLEKFNKGTLYNIAFLEIQRFGIWDCLIFHDVDLIPEDERISYSCTEVPTHMSPAVESYRYKLPYRTLFGGVTALTPKQYETVNGYSNFYWNWGAEDDDIFARIQSKNYTVMRFDASIARYATLPHRHPTVGNERDLLLMISKIRFNKEGLVTTKYKLINVTNEKLYTHILADVNPTKMKLDTKSLIQRVITLHGRTITYGQQEFKLADPSSMYNSVVT